MISGPNFELMTDGNRKETAAINASGKYLQNYHAPSTQIPDGRIGFVVPPGEFLFVAE